MINLRKAEIEESEEILEFYQNVISTTKGTEFKTRWSERYPNLEYIETGIKNQEFYICKENNKIIACFALNNSFKPEYENINWMINAKPDEIIIIHAFAVTSNLAGKGIGKEIFNQIKENSLKNNKKTIRIDIIDGNIGAKKVFEKLGFKYVGTAEITHQAVGLEKFHLYEYLLKKEKTSITDCYR